MSDILERIRGALAEHHHRAPAQDAPVIYLGRSEFYDLLLSMRGYTPVHIAYEADVRRVTCHGVELIEVQLPKYLRVA